TQPRRSVPDPPREADRDGEQDQEDCHDSNGVGGVPMNEVRKSTPIHPPFISAAMGRLLRCCGAPHDRPDG
ncbi:MAG: hypothetical protein OEY27_08400, partial [Gammaproteobacteria bacterium]|nr:hypothetical protein [Gammaproteobacteria bacterium]